MAPFREIEDNHAGDTSCCRSSTVITLLKPLSTPLSSTAVTRYCRKGTPLSWKLLEVVSPRGSKEPLETTSNSFHDNGVPFLQYLVTAVDDNGEVLQKGDAVVVEAVGGRFAARIEGAAGRRPRVHAIAREIRVGHIIPEEQNAQRTIGIAARLELVGQVGRRGRAVAGAVAVHEGRLARERGQQDQGQEHTHKEPQDGGSSEV